MILDEDFQPRISDVLAQHLVTLALGGGFTRDEALAELRTTRAYGSLTEQEMDESGEHWANHQGPYMTVAETLAYAAERAKQVKP